MAESPYSSSKRTRHSYIHFCPENWLGGVAGLPRIVWSVYFEICLYNWDKAKPMPESLLRMMLSDMPAEQGASIVEALIDSEKIERDEEGRFFSREAIEEAERQYRVWEAKSAGGSKGRGIPKAKKPLKAIPKDTVDKPSAIEAAASIRAAQSEADRLRAQRQGQMQIIATAWNDVARKHGWPQITRMPEARQEALGKCIAEHGVGLILAAMQGVPGHSKAQDATISFDWFLAACPSLVQPLQTEAE